MVADLGAVCFHLIDTNRKFNKFGAFRYVLSGGHETIAITKVMLKLLLDHGFDIFGDAYGFSSVSACFTLFRGFDLHICREFILEICRPVAIDELIRQWMLTNPQDASDVTALRQFTYQGSRSNDVHFDSHCFLVVDLLSSYSLYMEGQRTNVETLADAGKKFLLPLLGPLRHLPYWKGILRHFAEFHFRAHELVRLDRKRNYTVGSQASNKQGIDFLIENTIKDTKKLNFSNGPYGFLVAAIMSNVVRPFYNVLFKETGRNEPTYNRQRSPTKLEETRSACRKIIQECDDLFVIRLNRLQAMTMNGSEMNLEGTDSRALHKKGTAACAAYYLSHCTSLPERVKLRTQCNFEELIDADASDDDENENEDEEGEEEEMDLDGESFPSMTQRMRNDKCMLCHF